MYSESAKVLIQAMCPSTWQIMTPHGAKVCSDLIRDAVARLRDRPEWRLEVRDETDEPLHLFRLTAETFKKE